MRLTRTTEDNNSRPRRWCDG